MSVEVTDRAIEETIEMCREMASWSSKLEDRYINVCLAILSMELETDTTERGKVHRNSPYPLYVVSGRLISGKC